MRTFAEKLGAPQQNTSAGSTRPHQWRRGHSQELSRILHLQHTIGNQAVQRMLGRNTQAAAGGISGKLGVPLADEESWVNVAGKDELENAPDAAIPMGGSSPAPVPGVFPPNPPAPPAPQPAPPKLTKKTVSGPTAGTCGGFKWVVQWELDKKTTKGGWVVQKVELPYDVKDCSDKPVDPKKVGGLQPSWYPVWEAWPINKDQRVTTYAEGGDVEDDTYGDLRFIGARIPSCRSLPGAEHVIQLGSFSKSLAAGLRLGYLIAPDRVLARLAPIQEVHNISVPPLSQAVMARFLASGAFKRHLSRLRKALRERRDAMLEAIHASFPRDSEVTEPKGGMHLWVVLPEDLSALDLQRAALAHGLSFAPGPLFFPDGRGTNCLRLNFSTHAPSVTRDAIARLGSLIHARSAASTQKEHP